MNIPADVDPEKLTSTLSSDGILTVEAPVPPPLYPPSANSAFSPYQPLTQQQQQQVLQNTVNKAMMHRRLRPGTPCTMDSPSLDARCRVGQDTTFTTQQGR